MRQVNRVVGPDNGSGIPPADFNGNTHLADLSYTFSPAAKLTAYGYFLDLEEPLSGTALPDSSSSQTLGLRLAGDIKLNEQFAHSLRGGVGHAGRLCGQPQQLQR